MRKFSSFVAFRYLKADRENRFFSWIAILSVAGITISVAAMIVTLAVINGFEKELRNRFLNANAHVLAYRYPSGMTNPEHWSKVIREDFGDQVTGVSPFIHYETMVKHNHLMQAVLIRGIAPKQRETVQDIRHLIRPSSALDLLQKEIQDHQDGKPQPSKPSIIVGVGLLAMIDAKVGDDIFLISPSAEKQTEIRAFHVAGTYDSGLKHYDNKLAAMSIPAAQDFFDMQGRVTGIEIGLVDPFESPAIAAAMEDSYSLSVREWQSFNQPLFKAMQTERMIIALIVALIGIVAGFNILTTIFVSVTQKQKDISILKALGARNRQIVGLFLKQGAIIGFVGGTLGMILAFILSKILQTYQFIDLPDPYFLEELPVTYDARVYVAVALAAVTTCLIASFIPAFLGSRMNPSEGFRGSGQIT